MAYSFIHVAYVPTKHIAYFLSFFLCLFSLFSYLYVGVPWPWAVRFRWASTDFHDDIGSWEQPLLYLRFLVISFPYCIMTLLCRLSVEHCIYVMFLTMGVFTTSWWVVNQPIVMVIFPYVFYILLLKLVSYLWWGDTLRFMLILSLLLLSYSRAMFPCMLFFYLVYTFMYFISYCLLWHLLVTPLGHMFILYVFFWTMDVFTTSWWVVNQSIVVIFS